MAASLPRRMGYPGEHRDLVISLVSIALPLIILVAGSVLFVSLPLRWFAVALAGGAFVVGAGLSGNPRLLCLWGLMLTVPLNISRYFGWANYGHGGGEIAPRVEISDVFILALAAYLAWDIVSGRRPGFRIPKVTFVWIAIILLGCAWTIIGPLRRDAAAEVIRMCKMTVLFLVIVNELERPRRFLHAAAALTLSVVVQAVVALLQYYKKTTLGLGFLGESDTRTLDLASKNSVFDEGVFRVSALMLHPNLLAIFLAVLVPLAIGFLVLRVGKGYRLLFVSAVVLGMPALIVTLSRAGWMAFGVALTLLLGFMWLHPTLKRRSVILGAAAVLMLLPTLVIFSGPIMTRVFQSNPVSEIGREYFKEDAKRLIAEKPWLGWGPNSYTDVVAPFMKFSLAAFGGYAPPVHNIYYLWWAQTGLLGLVLYVFVAAAIIWTGVRNLSVKDELLFVVNAVCLAGILAFMLEEFLSFALAINPTLRIYWVLAGMIMAVRYCHLRQAASEVSTDPQLEAGSRA
jgi:putative inorganic carbon (hco3(-)) transporter